MDNNQKWNGTSAELAADLDLFEVWDRSVEFPMPDKMCDLSIVTHVLVEHAEPGGWHYLHEAAIMWHRDRFYICWANNPEYEHNNYDEIIRGKTSFDGIHWSEASIWMEAPALGAHSFNHPLLFSHGGKLYGFFVAWYGEKHEPTTEIFILNEETGKWEHQEGCGLEWFVPFGTPQKMSDGNWILSGENYWYQSAVAISRGNDMLHWDLVKIPKPEFTMHYPESAVFIDGDRIVDICRPDERLPYRVAPVSVSTDNGRTWSEMVHSNWPLSDSQPFAGKLSTGQNYLITNNKEENRALLSIAVTGPEGGLFKRIFKIRHQKWPVRRLFGGYGGPTCVGTTTEWSYPNAFEHNGNLYVAYSQGKEDCVLSIIPIEALKV